MSGAPDQISAARLEAALGLAAEVVDQLGPAYLPIFERLEAELAARDQSRNAVARARSLARLAGRAAA